MFLDSGQSPSSKHAGLLFFVLDFNANSKMSRRNIHRRTDRNGPRRDPSYQEAAEQTRKQICKLRDGGKFSVSKLVYLTDAGLWMTRGGMAVALARGAQLEVEAFGGTGEAGSAVFAREAFVADGTRTLLDAVGTSGARVSGDAQVQEHVAEAERE